jgi:hypothetical protein
MNEPKRMVMLGLIAVALDGQLWQGHHGLYDIQGQGDAGNSSFECALDIVYHDGMAELMFTDGETFDVIYADFVRALPKAMSRNDMSTQTWWLDARKIGLEASYGDARSRRVLRDMVTYAARGEQ